MMQLQFLATLSLVQSVHDSASFLSSFVENLRCIVCVVFVFVVVAIVAVVVVADAVCAYRSQTLYEAAETYAQPASPGASETNLPRPLLVPLFSDGVGYPRTLDGLTNVVTPYFALVSIVGLSYRVRP